MATPEQAKMMEEVGDQVQDFYAPLLFLVLAKLQIAPNEAIKNAVIEAYTELENDEAS